MLYPLKRFYPLRGFLLIKVRWKIVNCANGSFVFRLGLLCIKRENIVEFRKCNIILIIFGKIPVSSLIIAILMQLI